MKEYKIKSYAKVNLFLNVVGKRKKNHKIQSLFCFVNLHDNIKIYNSQTSCHKVLFTGTFSKFKKANNSIMRLLNILDQKKLLKKKYFIEVKKNIPTNSGLGGGSMNAGSVLKFFVSKKLVKLSKKKICEICDQIGDDTKIGYFGINRRLVLLDSHNKIKVIKKKLNHPILLIKPSFGCSTRKVFSKVKNFSNPLRDTTKLFTRLYLANNDLECIVLKLFPSLIKPINFLKNLEGSKFVRMTGSGSCFVAFFNSKDHLDNASKLFKKKYQNYWSVKSKIV